MGLALKVQHDQIFSVLIKVSAEYSKWGYVVAREKMIFDALNKSDYDIKRSNVTSIEGWVPTESLATVQQTLTQSEAAKGRTPPLINEINSRLTPPTFIPVTAFTSGFQALVNTYGTPRYREANPGAFCCIMFPYLFGIMFGDFGHGLLLAAFGLYAHQCYESCSLALEEGACLTSTIAAACPLSCGGELGRADTLTPGAEGVTQVKVCFSEMQSSIQQFLLVAAFVAVPFLLLPIPFIEMYQHSKSAYAAMLSFGASRRVPIRYTLRLLKPSSAACRLLSSKLRERIINMANCEVLLQ